MGKTDNFEDKILDNLLSDSMEDLYDLDEIPFDNLEEPTKEFSSSMDAMFQSEYKKLARRRRRRTLPKIAAVVSVFFVVGLLSISRVTAWKEPLYNFFFKPSDDGEKSKVDIEEIEEEDEFQKYLPEYIPEGFELVDSFYDETLEQYLYCFEKDNLCFNISIINKNSDMYQDMSEFKKIYYNNRQYFINKNNTILCQYKDYTIIFDGNLKKKEALKIIDSIK